MALFGGYNQKDYDTNTGIFKNRIQNMMNRCYEVGRNEQWVSVGKLLNAVMFNIERNGYVKASAKDQKAIDARISALIDTMERDLQERSPAKISAHAEMLLSAISDARSVGKELYTTEELEAQEQMASCKGKIYDALDEKSKVSDKKEEILKNASRTENKNEIAKLRIQYDECVAREKTLDKTVVTFTSRYNQFVGIVNAREVGRNAVELDTTKIVTVADFAKEVSKTNEILAKNAIHDEGISDVLSDLEEGMSESYGSFSADSSFDSILETKKNEKISESVDAMKMDASSSKEAEDDFTRALNNLK